MDFFFLGIHCSCLRVRIVNLIGFNYDDYTKHETSMFFLKIKYKNLPLFNLKLRVILVLLNKITFYIIILHSRM